MYAYKKQNYLLNPDLTMLYYKNLFYFTVMYLYTWKIGMCRIKLLIRNVQKLTPPENKKEKEEEEKENKEKEKSRLNKNFSTSGKFLTMNVNEKRFLFLHESDVYSTTR